MSLLPEHKSFMETVKNANNYIIVNCIPKLQGILEN